MPTLRLSFSTKTGPLAKIFTVLESTRRELSNGINLIMFACTTYNASDPKVLSTNNW